MQKIYQKLFCTKGRVIRIYIYAHIYKHTEDIPEAVPPLRGGANPSHGPNSSAIPSLCVCVCVCVCVCLSVRVYECVCSHAGCAFARDIHYHAITEWRRLIKCRVSAGLFPQTCVSAGLFPQTSPVING